MADGPKYNLLRGGGEQRALTPEQVREVRLSPDPDVAFAQRYGVSSTTIRACRSGHHYGPLADDELAAQRRRKDPVFMGLTFADNLLIVGSPYNQMWGLHPQDAPEQRDAAWECPHGRLAGDTTTPCGCFSQELDQPHEGGSNGSGGTREARVSRIEDQARRSVHRRPGRPASVPVAARGGAERDGGAVDPARVAAA